VTYPTGRGLALLPLLLMTDVQERTARYGQSILEALDAELDQLHALVLDAVAKGSRLGERGLGLEE